MSGTCVVDDATSAAQLVADRIAAHVYRWTTEVELQDGLWAVLGAEFACEREKALSRRDRPDFIVTVHPYRVAVEVKVKAARNAVLRQLGRYAEHDAVDAVLFVTGRRVLVSAVPGQIHGKPVIPVFAGSAAAL